MRGIFIGGQTAMAIWQILVGVFIQKDDSLATVIAILLFSATYQATQGSFFWFYAAAVGSDTANSIASIVLWGVVLLMSTCTNAFFSALTIQGTFYMFGGFCSLGALIFLFCMKEIKGLSKEE